MLYSAQTGNNMRYIFSILGFFVTIAVFGQDANRQRYIKIVYEPNHAYVEKAIERIEAVSTVLARTTVEYRAGQSVELLPGFQAKQGAVFTAHIRKGAENDLQLSAFPNPFEQSTTIDFVLPETGRVNLYVVDVKGQIVERLLENSQQEAGKHTIEWKADHHSPGTYIPVLSTDRQQISNRIIKK